MNQTSLEAKLADLYLGRIKYFDHIDSTNDEAKRWGRAGSPDLSLIVAEEQKAGRGRAGKRWHTVPGASLAFSLLFRDIPLKNIPMAAILPRMNALGALAVCEAVEDIYSLSASIKWPNDVLIKGNKVAGVLTEVEWFGNDVEAVIVGIGVNVFRSSAPDNAQLAFPATTLEQYLTPMYTQKQKAASSINRLDVLHAILQHMLKWRANLSSQAFMQTWEDHLAFIGEWVQITGSDTQHEVMTGKIIGLGRDGSLQLEDRYGNRLQAWVGDLSLRPLK
jgi:BirA family biotin operon repressor/biotin-[acetyl-CoA-carboxylase] ligase